MTCIFRVPHAIHLATTVLYHDWIAKDHIELLKYSYKFFGTQSGFYVTFYDLNKRPCGLWHSWKNMFLQFFECIMTLFYLVGKYALGWCSFVFELFFTMLLGCNGVTLCMLYRHGLYVCIILETPHHRTTSWIFCNITHKTTPEENSTKCSIFLHWLYFFLWEGQGIFLEIRTKFHLGREKGRGKWEYGGKSPKWGVYLQDSHH